jgi:hypothetical protein
MAPGAVGAHATSMVHDWPSLKVEPVQVLSVIVKPAEAEML